MPKHFCDFSIGDFVAGKYRIVKNLGGGSFGQVYQVADNTGKNYALKLLKIWELDKDQRDHWIQRFDMEYWTGKIDSPNLVHSLDMGKIDGAPYILMEFCSGGDLSHLPPSMDLNQVAHEVLYGLGSLHSNGKVHRDLKPENVMIKDDGTIALADFGISGDNLHRLTFINSRGEPLQRFGTLAYMPPEQLNPEKAEVTVLPTVDIFAFGVMMYKFLTGEMPFGNVRPEPYYHNDIANYTKRRNEGNWDRQAIKGSPFYKAIEGCLIPNYRQRLQSTEAVLNMLPPYNERPPEAPIFTPSTKASGYLLRIMQGEEYGKTYDLTRMLQQMNFLTVGRADKYVKNDIAIKEDQSTYISRRQCTIEKEADGTLKIRDGQRDIHLPTGWRRSKNGTYVNSAEASDRGFYLCAGDIISIGDVKVRFEPYEDHKLSSGATTI